MSLRVFISYSSKNRAIAIRVHDIIQSWGYKTWIDVVEITAGEVWPQEIQEGLNISDVIVGIVTSDSVNSLEVLAEWNEGYGKKNLILLRYEDIPLNYRWKILNYADCTQSELTGFEKLKTTLEQFETDNNKTSTLSNAAKEEIPSIPAYKSLMGTEENKLNSKRRMAVLILLLLLFIAATGYFLVDEKAFSIIALVVSTIPAIVALMPSEWLIFQKKPDIRARILENVYQTWIVGALYPNTSEGLIDTKTVLKADAVVKRADFSEYQLPDSSRYIAKIFRDMKGKLLILGEAGSGKTILMLQLAEKLLALAQADEKQAIPVVFNLSSWAHEQKPLADWLIQQLNIGYGISRHNAKRLVHGGNITLLLDGLDEIAPEQIMLGNDKRRLSKKAVDLRSACIKAINDYRKQYNMQIVVCSRLDDYHTLSQKLNLNGAILLSPLKDEQVEQHLAGKAYSGIRELLQMDVHAKKLARTPLIFTIMKWAYKDIPYEGAPYNRLKLSDSSEKSRQQHLFELYFAESWKQYNYLPYTSQQAAHYLRWLASQMFNKKQSIFYIEGLQSDWTQYKRLYRLIINLIFGLIAGLIFGQSAGEVLGLGMGLKFGLGSALGIWLSIWLSSESESNKKWDILGILQIGLIFGLIYGLIYSLTFWLRLEGNIVWVAVLGIGLSVMLSILVTSVLSIKLNLLLTNRLSKWLSGESKSEDVENIAKGIRNTLKNGILVGLIFWVVYVPIYVLVFGLFFSLILRVPDVLDYGLSFALQDWVIGWLSVGLSVGVHGEIEFPNRLSFSVKNILLSWKLICGIAAIAGIGMGMMNSFSDGLFFAREIGLIIMLSIGLSGDSEPEKRRMVGSGIRNTLLNGTIIGLIVAVIFQVTIGFSNAVTYGLMGLFGGGWNVFIRHIILRLLLIFEGAIPKWRYDLFLNSCVELGLLRKVGAGYIFRHRIIMEYLAEEYEQSKVSSV